MSYRSYIRKAISQVFFRFIYETGKHNGVGELLEILGSIINGFAIPLKKEHITFLEKALIPLHKPRGVSLYHPQLSYCISQYVEKDADTLVPIVQGMSRFWPWTCASKQVLFLNELEEILELCPRGDQLNQVQDDLFKLMANCLASSHFQVVERTLYLWNSENMMGSVLSQARAPIFLPVVFAPLNKCAQGHWNQTVEGLAQSVLKMYMDMVSNKLAYSIARIYWLAHQILTRTYSFSHYMLKSIFASHRTSPCTINVHETQTKSFEPLTRKEQVLQPSGVRSYKSLQRRE